jgi:hypothetical protein
MAPVTDTPTPEAEEATMTTIRTYVLWEIRWTERGSVWGGFHTAEEALAMLGDGAGEVVGVPFDTDVPAAHAHLYRPGIAERVA